MKKIVAALLLCMSGCSFLFVHGPPDDYRRSSDFDCTDASAWPVVDVLLIATVILPVVAAGAVAGNSDSREGFLIGGGAVLGLTTASAVVGFRKLQSCRNAREEMAARRRPGGQPSPWGPAVQSSPWETPPPPPSAPAPPPPPKATTPW